MELNTRDLSARKSVKIDGHDYVVRREGAGDDMRLNTVLAQMRKLVDSVSKKEESYKDLLSLAELQADGIRVVSRRYDDGGDGTKAFELISNLSGDERVEIERQIFGEPLGEALAILDKIDDEAKKADEPVS